MGKFMRFIYLFLFFFSITISYAGEWKLEVLNIKTREIKNFNPTDEPFPIPMELDGFTCTVTGLRGTSRSIMCIHGEKAVTANADKDPQYVPITSLVLWAKPLKGKGEFVNTFRLVLGYSN